MISLRAGTTDHAFPEKSGRWGVLQKCFLNYLPLALFTFTGGHNEHKGPPTKGAGNKQPVCLFICSLFSAEIDRVTRFSRGGSRP